MLGERIKHYRKERKLTLEQLAGTQMTKGMLSLIENNKARPSLENLEYIAAQLNISISDLLTDQHSNELRNFLTYLEKELNFEIYEDKEKLLRLINEIKPYLTKLEKSYESARILELYAISLFYNSDINYNDYFKKAANLYNELNITTKELEIRIGMVSALFIHKKYEESYIEVKKLAANLDNLYSHVEPLSKLEIAFHHAAFSIALGKLDEGLEVIDQALKLSTQKQVYYYIGELYRLAASIDIIIKGKTHSNYLEKLKLYGQFSDDFKSIMATELFHNGRLFNEKKYTDSYIHAVQMIAKLEASMQFHTSYEETVSHDIYLQYFKSAKGRALYKLKKIEEAIEILESVTIPKSTNYPLDISSIYLSKYYLTLCYMKLNEIEKAKHTLEESLTVLNEFPFSPTRDLFLQLKI